MGPERRRRLRVPVQIPGTISLDHEVVPITTLNLSLKGLLCTADPRLRVGAPCRVRLDLSPEISLHLKGCVVRVHACETAIDFTAMDADSFHHLLRLVEYHTLTPEQVLTEILAPAFPLHLRPRASLVRTRLPLDSPPRLVKPRG
jgi:hypothetical protein